MVPQALISGPESLQRLKFSRWCVAFSFHAVGIKRFQKHEIQSFDILHLCCSRSTNQILFDLNLSVCQLLCYSILNCVLHNVYCGYLIWLKKNMSEATNLAINEQCEPCLQHTLKGHKKCVTSVSFHPGNEQLATSSTDGSVMVWNLTKQIRCYKFLGHTDVVTDVDYSSTGRLLASASHDCTVRLWVPTVKGQSTDFRAHTAAVRSVSFSSDDKNVSSCLFVCNSFLYHILFRLSLVLMINRLSCGTCQSIGL